MPNFPSLEFTHYFLHSLLVSDYIPAGYTFAANNGWTGGPSVATRTIAGPIAPGASVIVPLVLTLQQNGGGGTAWDNYAEVTSAQDDRGNNRNDDADSVADGNPSNDNPVQPGDANDNTITGGGPNANPDEDEDDHDPAAPRIVDIALRKTTVTPGPYRYGDVVSFNVQVINQGNVDLSDIDVVDYIPCGFEYTGGSQTWTLNGTQALTNIVGILAAGSSITIRIDMTVIPCSTPNAWLNYAEVRNMEDNQGNNLSNQDIDSTPDNTNGNDDGGSPDSANDDFVDGNGKGAGGAPGDTATSTDEDDHDPELIQVFDLALRKTLATAGPLTYGQPVTFNIEVINQGNTTATNIVVSDYIPAGYSFSGAANPAWSGTAPLVTRTIAGPLAAGASTTISIVLTLEMSSGLTAWDNFAEITTATDGNGNPITDADSKPDNNPNNDGGGAIGTPADDAVLGNGTGTSGGNNPLTDEDDHDGARPRIVDIALRKTTVTPGPYRYGDVVSFNVELTNQGNVTLFDIDVVDYIPCGFTYVSGSQPWAVSGIQATTICAGSLVPGQSKTIRIDLRAQACAQPNAWTNYAEVRAFEDENGTNIGNQDIDSDSDSNNTNDAGGQPESPADDFIGGNGTGTPGSGVATTDEDDHDPEFIPVFDLALRKTLVTNAPYTYGQQHVYTIEVFNQGNVDAYNIVLNDYIPVGYTFNGALNAGWTLSGGTATRTIAGPLAPGASSTVQISLTYNMTAGGARDWINYSEIGSADNDQISTNTPPVDADSNPNSNTLTENTVTPGSPDDNNINGRGPNAGQDEDDHDPAGPSFYDVALRKTTTATGPFSYGQIVKFDVEILNQGNLPVRNVKVIDYIPSGFTGSALGVNFPTWTFGPNSATTTIPATLLPGQSTSVSIYLQVQPTTNFVTGWDNYAEVYQFEDTAGNNVGNQDVDSDPDTNPTNDPGGQPYSPADNFVDGNGTGTPGAGASSTDEDDHDPERIEIIDLALRKTLVTAGPYAYGDLLQFNIEVFNQGNEPMRNTRITDYIPAGYTFSAGDNPGWTAAGPNATYVVAGPLAPATSQMISIRLRIQQTTGGEKHWINYAEITDTYNNDLEPRNNWDIDSNPGSNGAAENAVEPGDTVDDNITSMDKGGEEDDHDPAGIEIYDLAQRKVTTATGPFRYGDIVKFTYEVFNQGSIQASGIDITDYIPCGMRYVAASNNALGWSYNATTGNATVTLPGSLIPGASRTIDIYLQVQPCIVGSTNAWTNIGEITGGDSDDPNEDPDDIDSDPDTDPDNDDGGEPDGPNDDVVDEDPNLPGDDDEDDHDPERLEIVDLALRKRMVTAGPYRYGQVIDFDIDVFNQGNVTMTNIEVINYIPEGFTYDPAINAVWQGAYPSVFTIIPGPLAPEASTTVRLKLKLVQTNGGSRVYTNGAEIIGMEDEDGNPRDNDDADSTPNDNPNYDNPVNPGDPNDDVVDESPNDPNSPGDDDEDDSDPAGPKIFDLALRKVQLTALPSFSYGQNVQFGISIFNQGNVDAKDIVIIDTLPCGLEYIVTPANTAAGWVYNAATREVRTTYSNVLAAGASVQLTLDNRVIPCYTNVGTAWTNWAEIGSADDNDPTTPTPPVDIDSTPDGKNNNDPGGQPNTPEDDEINGDPNNPNNPDAPQDEDDHDPNQIQVFDLALRKTVDDRGPYMIGETATFRIEVFNQGNVPARNIVINDYMRSGFTFNAAANPGWTLTTAPTSSTIGLLNYTISSTLMPGQSIILPLNLVVALDDNPNVRDWWNYAEIRSSQDNVGNNRNDDADSVGNTNSPRENEVEPDGPWDNVINGNGPNFNQDEDDHDPEKVIVVGGLGDTVWKDLDGDGFQDAGEPGVQGVIATLTDCRGNVLQTTTTDATGFYFFNNLIPGDYQVQFDIRNLPRGCAFTFQNQGTNDRLDSDVDLNGLGPCTNITGGEFDSTYDAGLLILAAIGDFVWHDLNGNGQQNAGEPGIAGVQVNLYKGDGTYVGTTYTDVNGYYLFDFLYPGDYYLEFIDPAGFESTFFNRGSDVTDSDVDRSNGPRTTATTYLGPGERDMRWDAGYYKCIPIGDLVWYDINKNDVWDTNENGINGLTVNLWRNHFGTWLIWDHTFTGNKPGTPSDDGYYKFCAPPGEYYVEVIMPPLGLVRARANVGTNEENDSDITNVNGPTTTDKFTVSSGQEKFDLGAGFYPQATAGNLVWIDANANGVQEAQEARMPGVLVESVMLSNGQVTESAVTDMDGTYMIEGLEKQQYFLKFTPPAGYFATVPRAAADNIDSDVDGSYGPNTTRAFDMQPASAYENIDMGLSFAPLPVEWLDVTARRVNNTHLIDWSVARESNVSYYEVERRFGSEKEFYTIPGKVLAKGNTNEVTNYNLSDLDVDKSGIYVYRVKQYDFDGKSSYSKLVKVSHNGENSIELYPNPARNETNVQIVVSQDAVVSVEMYDAASKLVKVIKVSDVQVAGDMIYNANLHDVPAGVYNVVITIDGVQTQRKLIRIE